MSKPRGHTHGRAWARERCHPCPCPPVAGGRVDPKVMRARELALPLIDCGSWENRTCASPAHHTRAGSVGEHETRRAGSALAGYGIR